MMIYSNTEPQTISWSAIDNPASWKTQKTDHLPIIYYKKRGFVCMNPGDLVPVYMEWRKFKRHRHKRGARK